MVKKTPSRNKSVRVKTAKRRTNASTRWLERQLNDPYVARAQAEGYRGRAAFKIEEINDKIDVLHKGALVVDLGAAPGGWCQVAAKKGCKVIGLDILEMDPMPGVDLIQMDFTDDEAPHKLIEMMKGEKADVIMSDMAPNTTGHKNTDHLRIMMLVELAYHFCKDVLKKDGTFIAKVRQGGAQNELLAEMKKNFKTIKHIKPPASRKESSETYLIAQGFRG